MSAVLVPLLLISGFYSYYRFVYLHDYLVSYHATCSPEQEDCFKECLNEDCTDVDYFVTVQRKADVLMRQCGPDIANCEYAQRCHASESASCKVTYCDPEVNADECDGVHNSASSI